MFVKSLVSSAVWAGTAVAVLQWGANSACADFASYFAAVMADNPEAYWSFEDGDSGDVLNGTNAADNSGNGHNGTYMSSVTDGPQLVARPGFGGNAAHFIRGASSAEGDYVLFDTLGNIGSNIDDNGVTFEFMIKNQQPDPTTNNRLFGIWNSRPDGNAETQVSFGFQDLQSRFGGPGDSFFLRQEGGAAWSRLLDQDMKDGEWHHVVLAVSPGVPEVDPLAVYVDGQLISTTAAIDAFTPKALNDFANFDKEFIIGGDHIFNGTKRDFLVDALVDEFAVYSGVLSPERVAAHAQAAGLFVPEPGSSLLVCIFATACLVTRNFWRTDRRQ